MRRHLCKSLWTSGGRRVDTTQSAWPIHNSVGFPHGVDHFAGDQAVCSDVIALIVYCRLSLRELAHFRGAKGDNDRATDPNLALRCSSRELDPTAGRSRREV
jgi:hypothetical protein